MSDVPCFVGIDVAKAQVDIALRPAGERWAVPNDASGVATLVDRVQTLHPTLIVLEATGGLERAATSAWQPAWRASRCCCPATDCSCISTTARCWSCCHRTSGRVSMACAR